MDELIQSWRAVETVSSSRQELEELVDVRLEAHLASVRKNQRYDMAGALFTMSLFIATAFILDLKYRWIVFASLIVFSLLLFIHYQMKYRVFKSSHFDDQPISRIIAGKITFIKRIQQIYHIGIPLFALALTTIFFAVYTHVEYWKVAVIGLLTATLIHVFVRLMWQWLYGGYSRQIESLERINRRLMEQGVEFA